MSIIYKCVHVRISMHVQCHVQCHVCACMYVCVSTVQIVRYYCSVYLST